MCNACKPAISVFLTRKNKNANLILTKAMTNWNELNQHCQLVSYLIKIESFLPLVSGIFINCVIEMLHLEAKMHNFHKIFAGWYIWRLQTCFTDSSWRNLKQTMSHNLTPMMIRSILSNLLSRRSVCSRAKQFPFITHVLEAHLF